MKIVYVDGACRGNPGPFAYAWMIDGKVSVEAGIGKGTNNFAELAAIWKATIHLEDHDEAIFYCDSKVAISWLTKNIPCPYDEFRQKMWSYVREHDIHIHFKRIRGKSTPQAKVVDKAAKAAIVKFVPVKKKLIEYIQDDDLDDEILDGRDEDELSEDELDELENRRSIRNQERECDDVSEEHLIAFLMGMFPGGLK